MWCCGVVLPDGLNLDVNLIVVLAVEMEGTFPIPPLFKAKQAIVSVSQAPMQGFTRRGGVV